MSEGPMTYWKRRAEAERELATKAVDPSARKAHEEMAQRYEESARSAPRQQRSIDPGYANS
jgi:hypothetical protein